MDDNVSANTVLVLILAWALRIQVAPLLGPSSRRSRALLLLNLMSVEAVDAPTRAQLERRLKLTKGCGDQVMGAECPLFCQGAGRVQHANFVPSRYFQGECFLVNTFVGLCNPGSTRDLQQLILLSFVACSTRWVGARFDGEPSKREVLLQSGPESTVIYMSAGNGIARLSVTESTETPRPFSVQQDTISNTSGTATVHTIFTRRYDFATVESVPATHIMEKRRENACPGGVRRSGYCTPHYSLSKIAEKLCFERFFFRDFVLFTLVATGRCFNFLTRCFTYIMFVAQWCSVGCFFGCCTTV